MDEKWFIRRMQEPVKNPDCNDCKWLNVTEEEQNNEPHICEKYKERVYHYGDKRFIHPCNRCVMYCFCNFKERHPNILIGIEHAEFCVHKIIYRQKTGESLLCKECPITECQFHGCSI